MSDLVYYIILGLLAVVALVLVFRRPADEDPPVSRRRYLTLIVDIGAIAVISVLHTGVIGLIGGC